MRIVGTHHVAILTPNLARLRAFYTERLALPVVGGFSGYNIIFIAAGNTTIELVTVQTGRANSLRCRLQAAYVLTGDPEASESAP